MSDCVGKYATLDHSIKNGAGQCIKKYEKMLDKAWQLGFSRLPDMKEKQNANIGTSFLSAFDAERRHQIRELLDMGK